MSVQVKPLIQVATRAAVVSANNATVWSNQIFPLGSGAFRVLYQAIGKAVLVKSIRLVNSGSIDAVVTLYFVRPTYIGPAADSELFVLPAPKIRRIITPKFGMSLKPDKPYNHEINLVLAPGDMIQAQSTVFGSRVSFLLSGVET